MNNEDKIIQLEKADSLILYNTLTGRRIFTSRKELENIPKKEINKLNECKINLKKKTIRRYRVETTFRCNANCDYCLVYNNPLNNLNQDMELNTAKKIVKRFNKEVNGGSIMLMGGEPLLNLEVVKYFIENTKASILLFSNGSLVTDEIAKYFAKKNNVFISISLDGRETENFHRKDRNGKPLFEDSLRGYQLLKKNGVVNTGIGCLVTDDNVYSLFEIVKYFHEELGEKNIGLSYPHKTRSNCFNLNMKTYSSQMQTIYDYAKKNGLYIPQLSNILKPLINNTPLIYGCKICGEQRTFYPDGKETLCTKLDTLKQYKDKKAEYFLKMSPYFLKSCQSCEAIALCGGGCYWDMTFSNKSRDENNCYFIKNIFRKLLWDMYDECPKNKVIESSDLKIYYPMIGVKNE